MRNWEGVLVVEGEQTGDGRIIAEGALEWSELPLPLGLLVGEQHGTMIEGAVQIGTIESITRDGMNVRGAGLIDDEKPEAAELCRQMDAGTAAHGSETYVSIDPDDWEVEIVATDAEDEGGVLLLASGTGTPPAFTAAAGDGDPEEEGEGTVLFEDAADSVIERYTRLRIRGATIVAIPAFDSAIIRLTDGEPASGEGEETPAEEGEPEAEAASATVTPIRAAAPPVAPPAEWFDDPAFGNNGVEDERLVRIENSAGEEAWAAPLTVTEDGRVFGHVAPWDVCHIGNPGVCLTAPSSETDYAYFKTGAVQPCETDCDPIPVGVLTLGGGHADIKLGYRAASEHYDDVAAAVAEVNVGEDDHGIWVAGALRPGVTEEQLRVLRASPLSGDWRQIGGHLEMVAAHAVNVGGFPIPRAHVASGQQMSLVAAGAPALARLKGDPGAARLRDIERRLARVEQVTRPLRSTAQAAIAASVSGSES